MFMKVALAVFLLAQFTNAQQERCSEFVRPIYSPNPQLGVDCPNRFYFDGRRCVSGTLPCAGLATTNNFVNRPNCQRACEVARKSNLTPPPALPGKLPINPRCLLLRAPPITGPVQLFIDCENRYWFDPATRRCRKDTLPCVGLGVGNNWGSQPACKLYCEDAVGSGPPLGGPGGSGLGDDHCHSHSECPSGRCDLVAHECESYSTGGNHCHSDSECGSDEYCDIQNFNCVPRRNPGIPSNSICRGDYECYGNQVCQNRQCVTKRPDLPPGLCRTNLDCARGEVCRGRQCVTDSVITPPIGGNQRCRFDYECRGGSRCVRGYCEADSTTVRRRGDGRCPAAGCPDSCDFCDQGRCVHDTRRPGCDLTSPPTSPPFVARQGDGRCPVGGCPDSCDYCDNYRCIHDTRSSRCNVGGSGGPIQPPGRRWRCPDRCDSWYQGRCRFDPTIPGCRRGSSFNRNRRPNGGNSWGRFIRHRHQIKTN